MQVVRQHQAIQVRRVVIANFQATGEALSHVNMAEDDGSAFVL